MVGIGKVYGVIISFFVLNDIRSGHWRFLMIISSVPCLIVSLGTYFYVYESARFLMISNQSTECIKVMNKMIEINNKNPEFVS